MEKKISLHSLVVGGGSQRSPFLERKERPRFFWGEGEWRWRERKRLIEYYYLVEKTREDKKKRGIMEGSEEPHPQRSNYYGVPRGNAFSKFSFLRSDI